MIDAHIHLDQYHNIDKQVESWMNAGITHIVAVSTDLASSYQTLEYKKRYPTFISCAIGFHPEQELPNSTDLVEWQTLLKKERHLISAIGEVGLPYYTLKQRKQTNLAAYIEFLEEMIKISVEQTLPIALHAVHEHADIVVDMLVKHHVKQAHFHWLKAKSETLAKIIQNQYFVSVTPEVVYRKRDQELVKKIPKELLLLETDGPWPFSDIFDGRETTPLFLKEMLPVLSKLLNEDVNAIRTNTSTNACEFYNIFSI